MNIEDIFFKYKNSKLLSISPLGDGHINDTFLVKTDTGKYVMQRVRNSMDIDSCLYNYGLYSDICKRSCWSYPVWIVNSEGRYFYTDETGYHWRLYSFIDGEILSGPVNDDILFSCGEGLAKMHMIFSRLTDRPKAVYPHLHDLEYYYDTYQKVLNGREIFTENRDAELEEIIDLKSSEMLAVSLDRSSVVHGDAKLANILFKAGKVIGFIDLDTLMMGSRLEDLADCIRSCCIENGTLNKYKADKMVQGYTSIATDSMISDLKKLPKVFDKICFELGLRYYTDAIAKDKVFKEKYPGYRLERARSLIKTLSA